MLLPEPDADTAAANEGDGGANKCKYVNVRCIKCKGDVVLTSLCCGGVYKERGLD